MLLTSNIVPAAITQLSFIVIYVFIPSAADCVKLLRILNCSNMAVRADTIMEEFKLSSWDIAACQPMNLAGYHP